MAANSLKTPVAIIVAAASNGVIGRDNQLPWRLVGELKYFKATTLGKPVVMGRKTFDSIGRPLPGRTNIVITRNADFAAEGVLVARSLEEALHIADGIARRDGAAEIMVIGGAQIYRQALPQTRTLYLTRVHAAIEGDAHFPEIDEAAWQCVRREDVAEAGADSPAYSLLVYQRV
jgi:dihydrofolate reductase